MKKLFVYGSLRYGMYNYVKYLQNCSKYVGKGYIKGTIYSITNKKYPAYLPDGDAFIVGDIFEISDEVLEKIDKMENYNSNNIEQNEYNRLEIPVYDENHKYLDKIHTYVFNKNSDMNKSLVLKELEKPDYVEMIGKFL